MYNINYSELWQLWCEGGVLLNDNYANGKDNKKEYEENKMNYNLVNFCEFDKYAVKSYCAIHDVDEGLNLGDITKVDIESLPINIDLITHGSPCFAADTLVLTDNGYKPIVEVKVGDMVLDHKLSYSMVTNFFEQGKKEIWEIESDFIKQTIRTTSNHKFYVKTSDNVKPRWIECNKLKLSYKLALVDNSEIKWVPINSITNTHKFEEVYDIEVENTHSFTANGIIAHNCQSFSVAGKQHGGEKGSGTRSSLLWNSVEIIRHCKPKFVIWENVKNVLSKKHKPVFDAYVDEMKNIGYNTYYQVLNAKNYGIPQNRERIYAISIREDIDNNPNYTGHIDHNKYYDRFDESLFPKPFDNGLRLKDFLEDEVDEKYYLKDEYVERFIKNPKHKEPKQILENTNRLMQLGDISPDGKNSIQFRVYDDSGISPTLRTPSGGHTEVKIVDDNNSAIINPLKNKTKYGWHFEQNVYDSTGLMRTLKAGGGSGNIPKVIEKEKMTNERAVDIMRNEQCCQDDATFVEAYEKAIEALKTTTNSLFRIRKLTPKECYRLMGFSDEDFKKAAFVKEIIKLEGGDSICNAKLKVVTDKHKQNDMETYVLNTTNNTQGTEISSIKMKKLAKMLESEKMQNVNIVIEKSEGRERLECATNIIKCGDYMGMHYTLITEKDLHRHMAIIVQVKKGLGNTEKYMKITTESDLLQNKLYTILTLFAQIIELKIFTSTTVSLSIQGFMQSIEDCEKNILMKLSNLEMERTASRNSNSALYRQAGNSIVVNVLEEIYKCLHNAYPNDFTKGMNVMSLFSGIGAFEKALERVDFD